MTSDAMTMTLWRWRYDVDDDDDDDDDEWQGPIIRQFRKIEKINVSFEICVVLSRGAVPSFPCRQCSDGELCDGGDVIASHAISEHQCWVRSTRTRHLQSVLLRGINLEMTVLLKFHGIVNVSSQIYRKKLVKNAILFFSIKAITEESCNRELFLWHLTSNSRSFVCTKLLHQTFVMALQLLRYSTSHPSNDTRAG